uniref:Reverse transcriptase domain-containing protein n=1 Tax=Salvator merianae TaxID=96440 RepID=A0A8D0BSK0_SALMN
MEKLHKNLQYKKVQDKDAHSHHFYLYWWLEVMNRAIRQETNIEGLKIKKEEYRLKAFADDIVIILKDPMESIETVKLIL